MKLPVINSNNQNNYPQMTFTATLAEACLAIKKTKMSVERKRMLNQVIEAFKKVEDTMSKQQGFFDTFTYDLAKPNELSSENGKMELYGYGHLSTFKNLNNFMETKGLNPLIKTIREDLMHVLKQDKKISEPTNLTLIKRKDYGTSI